MAALPGITFKTRPAMLFGAMLAAVIAAGLFAREAWFKDRLLRADINSVAVDPALLAFGVSRGESVFASHCAACHGRDARGDQRIGAANLTDSEWLYGDGHADQIERIAAYGIRAHNSRTWDMAQMPAFAHPKPSRRNPEIAPLRPRDISDLTDLILSLNGHPFDPAARARGKSLFEGPAGCSDCHGADARGDSAIGAPDLTDGKWLHGDGERQAVSRTIADGFEGVCPAWMDRLGAAAIREVALYVHALSHRPGASARPTTNRLSALSRRGF